MTISKIKPNQEIKAGSYLLMKADGGYPYLFHQNKDTKAYIDGVGRIAANVSKVGESWSWVAILDEAYLVS